MLSSSVCSLHINGRSAHLLQNRDDTSNGICFRKAAVYNGFISSGCAGKEAKDDDDSFGT